MKKLTDEEFDALRAELRDAYYHDPMTRAVRKLLENYQEQLEERAEHDAVIALRLDSEHRGLVAPARRAPELSWLDEEGCIVPYPPEHRSPAPHSPNSDYPEGAHCTRVVGPGGLRVTIEYPIAGHSGGSA